MFERLSEEARQRLRRLTLELAGDRAPALEALAHRSNGEYGVDPFGFDLDYALSAVAPFVWLYRKYFRVETHGIEQVPVGPGAPGGQPLRAAPHRRGDDRRGDAARGTTRRASSAA